MEKGMLWFDDSKRTLIDKVKNAAQHFQKKYGRVPDLCLVHPSNMEELGSVVPFYGKDIVVRPYRPVLPGHLWIGLDEDPKYVDGQTDKGAEVQTDSAAEVQG